MQEQTRSTIPQQRCPQGKFSALSPPERPATTSKHIARSTFCPTDLIDAGQTMRAIFDAVTFRQQRGWFFSRRRPDDVRSWWQTKAGPRSKRRVCPIACIPFLLRRRQYQNGVDMHLGWDASQFLSKQVMVGPPDQLTNPLPHLQTCQQTDVTRRAADAFLGRAACPAWRGKFRPLACELPFRLLFIAHAAFHRLIDGEASRGGDVELAAFA